METSAQILGVAGVEEKPHVRPQSPPKDGYTNQVSAFLPTENDNTTKTRKWKWSKTTLAFFLMGILVGLPTMPITTAANQMFRGVTGVYGICLSLTAAVASFAGPILGRYLSYNACTIILTVASALAYVVCTLPEPLSNSNDFNKAGPVVGTMLAGFVYAFGTQTYLAVAAFFPSESVVALSVGSGLSIILGSGVYIGLMKGPFNQDWRRAFLVFLPTVICMPLIWWFLFDSSRRQAAEQSRVKSFERLSDSSSASDAESAAVGTANGSGVVVEGHNSQAIVMQPGFGPNKTRTGMLFKLILPKYVLPLVICTSCAIFSLFGLAPALQTLNRFKSAPEGELEFHLVFFAYGSAQFLFSTLVAIKPMPVIWIWTGAEIALTTIALIQIWHPFLTHFGVWFVFMFFIGGCVGGSVTNTNYKIAEDFRKAGEPDEVRSFANSYAGLGNFGGDAIGGALGLVIEQVLVKNLRPSS